MSETNAAIKTLIRPETLDEFIERSDHLGGPDAPATKEYWEGVTYNSRVAISEDVDPYGEQYVQQQISLYEEISGRTLDQEQNELTSFDPETLVEAPNPYPPSEPHALALHFSRLSRAIQYSGLMRGMKIIDVGCGWGLSSELLGYLGVEVAAIDINAASVDLVNKRAARSGLKIHATRGSFEHIPIEMNDYDAAMYYECLHHAVRPWIALSSVKKHLRPGAKLILAGEPLNYMWKTWGIRTDPLSIYCVRKFGWFESGWTPEFLRDCVARCGFNVDHFADEGGTIAWIMIATKR